MKIKNIEGLHIDELEDLVLQGGKFVLFQYTVSIVVMTFKRPTAIYFIRSGETAAGKHIGYTALSLITGWWDFPGALFILLVHSLPIYGAEKA